MKKRNIIIIGIIIVVALIGIVFFIISKQSTTYKVEGYNGEYDGRSHGIVVTVEDGTVLYGIAKDEYNSTTSPVRTDVGITTVYYQIKRKNHKTIIGTANIVITSAENKMALSETSNDYVFPATFTFDITRNLSGGKLSCETSDAKIATCSISDTKVTVNSGTEVGEVKIIIKSAAKENYKAGTITYTASISNGSNEYKASGYNGTYDGNAHGISVISKDSTIKYGTTEGTYNKDQSPTRTEAGTTMVYYQITKKGYKTITGKEKIVINKANGNADVATTIYIGKDETRKISINNATGTISCASENNTIATCSISGKTITIKGLKTGSTNFKINIADSNNYNAASKTINVNVVAKNCTYSGELKDQATYKSDQYTYTYLNNKSGWNVELTNKDSTDQANSSICNAINDKPIVSTNKMFYKAKAIAIDISSLDSSNVTEMESMFEASSAITITGLNKLNTSKVTNMKTMFYQANASTLDVSSFDTSKVINMAGMFHECRATSITGLNNFNTSSVVNMSHMFEETNLTALDVSNLNTSNVNNMQGMFYGSSAKSITGLNKFNTSNVTDMSWMFASTNVQLLDLSSFNTSNVTNMGHMFKDTKLLTIDLSTFNTSNVTNMTGMFENCPTNGVVGLTNFNTSKVKSMSYMFYNTKMSIFDLRSFDLSSVTAMDKMFANSIAIRGFAKDDSAAAKFNSTSDKPSTLTFIATTN